MKTTYISIIIVALLIGGAILFVGFNKAPINNITESNVSIIDGKQIIEIGAKGGYAPKVSIAKAGISNILRVQTSGTFDCSSALTIPSISYRTNLPPSGITEIEIPEQIPGTTLQGLCSMGMYSFKIEFK